MYKIVVLDGYPYNKSDFDFLSEFGSYQFFSNTHISEIQDRIKNVDIILTNKVNLDIDHFKNNPNIKYIGIIAAGFDNIDIISANKYGITVTNAPGYGTDAVMQHTFALILNITNRINYYSSYVKNNQWLDIRDNCFKNPLFQLSGKTLGIIGFGAIGQSVAKIASAFGCNILVYSRKTYNNNLNIKFKSLHEVLKHSDIVSLHCPLNKDTQQIINTETLNMMKSSSILINTSRGGLINEIDLYNSLKHKKILAAALDVLSVEPPCTDHMLTTLDNCIITPHIAWATKDAMNNILSIVNLNLANWINKTPTNVLPSEIH